VALSFALFESSARVSEGESTPPFETVYSGPHHARCAALFLERSVVKLPPKRDACVVVEVMSRGSAVGWAILHFFDETDEVLFFFLSKNPEVVK
jgi:hypothetical protein